MKTIIGCSAAAIASLVLLAVFAQWAGWGAMQNQIVIAAAAATAFVVAFAAWPSTWFKGSKVEKFRELFLIAVFAIVGGCMWLTPRLTADVLINQIKLDPADVVMLHATSRRPPSSTHELQQNAAAATAFGKAMANATKSADDYRFVGVYRTTFEKSLLGRHPLPEFDKESRSVRTIAVNPSNEEATRNELAKFKSTVYKASAAAQSSKLAAYHEWALKMLELTNKLEIQVDRPKRKEPVSFDLAVQRLVDLDLATAKDEQIKQAWTDALQAFHSLLPAATERDDAPVGNTVELLSGLTKSHSGVLNRSNRFSNTVAAPFKQYSTLFNQWSGTLSRHTKRVAKDLDAQLQTGTNVAETPPAEAVDPRFLWSVGYIQELVRQHYLLDNWKQVEIQIEGKKWTCEEFIRSQWKMSFEFPCEDGKPRIYSTKHDRALAVAEATRPVVIALKAYCTALAARWEGTAKSVRSHRPQNPKVATYPHGDRLAVHSLWMECRAAEIETVVAHLGKVNFESQFVKFSDTADTSGMTSACDENLRMVDKYAAAARSVVGDGQIQTDQLATAGTWYSIFEFGGSGLGMPNPFHMLAKACEGIPQNLPGSKVKNADEKIGALPGIDNSTLNRLAETPEEVFPKSLNDQLPGARSESAAPATGSSQYD